MGKSYRKSMPKVSARPFFNFGKWPKTANCMLEILLKIRYFERIIEKTSMSTFIFSFEPSPF